MSKELNLTSKLKVASIVIKKIAADFDKVNEAVKWVVNVIELIENETSKLKENEEG